MPRPSIPNLGKEDVEHQRSGKQIEVILTLFRNRQMEVPQRSTHLRVSGEENKLSQTLSTMTDMKTVLLSFGKVPNLCSLRQNKRSS